MAPVTFHADLYSGVASVEAQGTTFAVTAEIARIPPNARRRHLVRQRASSGSGAATRLQQGGRRSGSPAGSRVARAARRAARDHRDRLRLV